MTQEQLSISEWSYVDGVPVTTVQRALFDEVRRIEQRAREGQRDRDGRGRAARSPSGCSRSTSPCADPGPASRVPATPYCSRSTTVARRRSSGCTCVGVSMPSFRCRCSTVRCTTSTVDSSGSPTCSTPSPGLLASIRAKITRTGSATAKTWSGRRSSATTAWSSSRSSVAISTRRQTSSRPACETRERRAKFLPPESRAWTLETPPWRTPPESLDAYLVRRGLADQLWRT